MMNQTKESELVNIKFTTPDIAPKDTISQPFMFLYPLEGEILEAGSDVSIFWKGGPALPQKVNISLIDSQPGKVIASVVLNHIELINPGLYQWTISKKIPLLHDHTYQFYIQDVPRTMWTYGPVFKIN
jgi:hypothetical protein